MPVDLAVADVRHFAIAVVLDWMAIVVGVMVSGGDAAGVTECLRQWKWELPAACAALNCCLTFALADPFWSWCTILHFIMKMKEFQ